MKIYKYPLELQDKQKITFVGLCDILSIQNQNGNIVIWVSVDEHDSYTEEIEFHIVETGKVIPDYYNLQYLDTVQIGIMVWHIFRGD